MNHGIQFTLAFAKLLGEHLGTSGDLATQRALVTEMQLANGEDVVITWDNWRLLANGEPVSPAADGVAELVARMAAHSVREIRVSGGTNRAHLGGSVGVLAQDPSMGDEGSQALARLAMLGADTVAFIVASERAPLRPSLDIRVITEEALTPDDELFESGEHASVAEAAEPGAAAEEPAVTEPEEADVATTAADPRPEGMQRYSAPLWTPDLGADANVSDAIHALERATTSDDLSGALGALTEMISAPGRAPDDIAAMLRAAYAKSDVTDDREHQLMFATFFRRTLHGGTLRLLAARLPAAGERAAMYVEVLRRAGEDGADALIDALVDATVTRERRVLFDTILELGMGVKTLHHMLGDSRWFVVRNATELLSRMKVPDVETDFVALLRHDDQRVRRSAANALSKLGTPSALAALTAAMEDASPNVRMQATLAVAARRESRSLPTFIKALEQEDDPEVQATLIRALGKLGNPPAVHRLMTLAQAPTGLLARRRKNTAVRVAAVNALAEAGTPTAIEVLHALSEDSDAEVRASVRQVLANRAAGAGLTEEERTAAGW